MAQITNLNRFRKQKTRDEARQKADSNAAKHGRSKAERRADQAERDRAARLLDGAKRDD